jgi:hypothetical protein
VILSPVKVRPLISARTTASIEASGVEPRCAQTGSAPPLNGRDEKSRNGNTIALQLTVARELGLALIAATST